MNPHGYYVEPGDVIPDGLNLAPVVIFEAKDFFRLRQKLWDLLDLQDKELQEAAEWLDCP